MGLVWMRYVNSLLFALLLFRSGTLGMKAAPFDYVRAHDVSHALEVLEQWGGEARLLAGGQSMVPMMAMRLARPACLVDIDRIADLKNIVFNGSLVSIGAGVRQCTVEHSPELSRALPLVVRALHWVGHQQTRNRGTVGGSLSYADPSAELPLASLVLEATLNLESRSQGVRSVAASDFFLGPMFTALATDECLVSVNWPIWQGARVACRFEETAIRQGDFAMASAASQMQLDELGRLLRLNFGLGGVDGTPLVFADLAQALLGHRLTLATVREISHAAAARAQPGSDIHAGADYRRNLASVLLQRVLWQSYQEALQPQ
jgi:CO/xanthine dehydrogenase FAD-binding subunit